MLLLSCKKSDGFMQKLFILDASCFLFRSYFAIRYLTNSKGESTNALYGFIRSILRLFKDFNPSHIVAVFDGPGSITHRLKIYPDYKQNRKETPEDLRYQIKRARQFCKLAGIPFLSIKEVEADDTIGSIALWASKQGSEVFLCSSDKDLCQLVSDRIFLLNTHQDNLILNKEKVEEIYGVRPDQIIDYLAIAGDASDNVPGLSGFGPKTAATLLKQMNTLENILANPDQVPGKKKQETIKAESELAKLSKALVTLHTNVPFPKEIDFFKLQPSDQEKLKDFFSTMDFHTLIKDMRLGAEQEVVEDTDPSFTYHLIDTASDLDFLIKVLANEKLICLDTETTNKHPIAAELVGIGVGIKEKEAYYIPANGQLGCKQVIERLRPLFENPSIGFYGHNIKYDFHILLNYGITIANIAFDTLLASYLLTPHLRQHSLDALALKYFDTHKTPISELIGKGKDAITMKDVPIDDVKDYCCADVDYTIRLKALLEKQLHDSSLWDLFNFIELPLIKVLAKMERNGIFVDIPYLNNLSLKLNQQIQVLEKDIHNIAEEDINIKSPKQLAYILFDKLQITPPKKNKTGFSTNAQVLESLKGTHSIIEKILEFRTLEKLRSTYTESLIKEVYPKTGRVHCSFNQFITATGRLSSQNPNLQNIPVRSKAGKEIRAAFKPEKAGWSYLAADYSQIELRILAHFCQDPNLLSAFRNNEDIHISTASHMFHIPLDQVSDIQRYQAKAVNFGIIYGQQSFGLSQQLGITVKEANEFIERYFDRYSKVKEFIKSCKQKAKESGIAKTIAGRIRPIPEINSKNNNLRMAAERLAINTPIQGSNADIIKKAMIKLDELLTQKQKQSFIILQIHDELILEVLDNELVEMQEIVRLAMEHIHHLDVPLLVDIKIGKNWKEC